MGIYKIPDSWKSKIEYSSPSNYRPEYEGKVEAGELLEEFFYRKKIILEFCEHIKEKYPHFLKDLPPVSLSRDEWMERFAMEAPYDLQIEAEEYLWDRVVNYYDSSEQFTIFPIFSFEWEDALKNPDSKDFPDPDECEEEFNQAQYESWNCYVNSWKGRIFWVDGNEYEDLRFFRTFEEAEKALNKHLSPEIPLSEKAAKSWERDITKIIKGIRKVVEKRKRQIEKLANKRMAKDSAKQI